MMTMTESGDHATAAPERLLLVVEDDAALSRTLSRSFERRGYRVITADSLERVRALLAEYSPGYAVVDLKLHGDASGLACVQALHEHDPAMLIVVLTGFASIATAVEAIKLGACHYLAKPSNTDDIEHAFQKTEGNTDVELATRQASIKTLEWERIHEMRVAPISISPRRRAAWHAPPHAGTQAGKETGQVSSRPHAT